MLPPFPLVPCGVPRGCSEWLRPDVIAPVSSETVRLVGTAMKDKWGDSRGGTSPSVTSEVHEGNRVPPRPYGARMGALWDTYGVLTGSVMGYPKKLILFLIYKCNKYLSKYFFPKTNFYLDITLGLLYTVSTK